MQPLKNVPATPSTRVSTLALALLTLIALSAGCTIFAPKPYQPVDSPQHRAAAAGNRAMNVLLRAEALRQMANEAVKADGTPAAAAASRFVNTCQNHHDPCLKFMHDNEKDSKVGALAGFALYLTQPLAGFIDGHTMVRPAGWPAWTLPPDLLPLLQAEENVQEAEGFAKQALDEAHKAADARDVQGRQVSQEMQAVAETRVACAKDPSACKSRCDKEPMYCFAWAGWLWDLKPPKLVEVKAYLQRACDGGVASACSIIGQVDQQIAQATMQVEQSWGNVMQAGDELTERLYLADKVARMGRSSGLRDVLLFNQAVVAEKFCPARRTFVQAASVAEFTKRAAKHCKEETPVGRGISGADVPLTALCGQAYATSCP